MADQIETRVDKVRLYASTMADRYLEARFKLEILEPMKAPEFTALMDGTYGGHAYNMLSLTLLLDLVRECCAFVLDRHDRAPSLANIWAQISEEDLRKALREAAGHKAFDDRDRAERQIEFDSVFDKLRTGIPRILDSEISDNFLKARNKGIAHYDMQGTKDGPKMFDLSAAKLTWGAPREFLDGAAESIWGAVLVATWGSYDIDGFNTTHKTYAEDFWARVRGTK